MERVVAREGGTRVVMGIRWRNGLNVFNMDTEIKLPKKVVHKGHVGLSMEGWKKVCGAWESG